jgi:hypothetical protein
MRYLTKPTQKTFLQMLAVHGNISKSVEETNKLIPSGDARGDMSRFTVYHWKRTQPQFREKMEEALSCFADKLESIALERVSSSGTSSKGSDLLLMFLLNSARPLKYRSQNGSNSTDGTKELLSAVRLKLSATTNNNKSTDIVVDIGTVTTNSSRSMDQDVTNS